MCGLVGVMTEEVKMHRNPHHEFFRQALFVDTLRGYDSTGVAVMDLKDKRPEIFKKALAAPDFLQLSPVLDLLDDSNSWNIMMGHNRWATKGGIKHHTSHPFQIGDITLMHNGTLTTHHALPKGSTFTVDSEAIANSINEIGIEETVPKLNGAFALTWHDAVTGTMNFIRNDERPLWFATIEKENTILYASEPSMLRWLAVRNGFKVDKVFQPAAGYLHTYKVGAKGWVDNPKVVKLELYTAPVRQWPTQQHANQSNRMVATSQQLRQQQEAQNRQRAEAAAKAKKPSLTANTRNVMKKLGILTEDVTFIPEKFKAYSKNGSATAPVKGEVSGTVIGDKQSNEVKLYSVFEEDWLKYMKDNFIISKVHNGYFEHGNRAMPIIIADEDNYQVFNLAGEVLCSVGTDMKVLKVEKEEIEQAKKLYRGPCQTYIPLEEFEKITDKGCAHCTGNVYAEEELKLDWTDDGQPICPDCVSAHKASPLYH